MLATVEKEEHLTYKSKFASSMIATCGLHMSLSYRLRRPVVLKLKRKKTDIVALDVISALLMNLRGIT